jgi:AMP-binding enzyme/Bacterial extracellular solute-binding proteins, family 3
LALTRTWQFSSDDVLLHALPIYHTHRQFVVTNVILRACALMSYLPKFDANEVVALLPRATAMMSVPTFYPRLLANPAFNRETASSIRLFISGSSPLLASTHEDFRFAPGCSPLQSGSVGAAGQANHDCHRRSVPSLEPHRSRRKSCEMRRRDCSGPLPPHADQLHDRGPGLGGNHPALQAGKHDEVMSGMNITDKRLAVIGFSRPYATSRHVFATVADKDILGLHNAGKLVDITDLNDEGKATIEDPETPQSARPCARTIRLKEKFDGAIEGALADGTVKNLSMQRFQADMSRRNRAGAQIGRRRGSHPPEGDQLAALRRPGSLSCASPLS